MKTALTAFAAIMLSLAAHSQHADFDGNWTGTVTLKEKGTTLSLQIIIDSCMVREFNDNVHNQKWFRSIHATSSVSNNTLLFNWKNITAFTSEQQSFTITQLDKDSLAVAWIRKCTVYTNKKNITDQQWIERGYGILTRTSTEAIAQNQ